MNKEALSKMSITELRIARQETLQQLSELKSRWHSANAKRLLIEEFLDIARFPDNDSEVSPS